MQPTTTAATSVGRARPGPVIVKINDGGAIGATLDIRVERIDASTSWGKIRPDRDWWHVDPAGHWHAWAANDTIPTARATIRKVPCDAGTACACEGAGSTEPAWECIICAVPITPGTVTDRTPQFVDGRMDWSLTVDTFIPRGQQVTVQIVDLHGYVLAFGAAVAGGGSSSSSHYGTVHRTELSGITPLAAR